MSSSDASGEQYPFADLDLARRLERVEAHAGAQYVEAKARLLPQSGAEWIDVAGVYALYDSPPSEVTQTFGLGLFEEATSAVLDQIEGFYAERGAPVLHEVSPLTGFRLLALLHERGYRPFDVTSILYRRTLDGMELPLPLTGDKQFRVRPIGDDAQEQEMWAQTAAKGWSEFAPVPYFREVIRNIVAQGENALALIAERDGQPVATASMNFHEGVALMAGASTIPEARRQGAQLALLDARLRFAAERGCDLAMMGAEPGSASQRNAERNGFRIAYTRIKWLRPRADRKE